MPTQTVKYPFINPLTFYKDSPDAVDRFRSKDFDDWGFSDTILPWQEKVCWAQPWQKSDTLHLQLQSTYSPINLKLYRKSDDALIDTIAFDQIRQNYNDPTLWIYEVDVDLSGYAEDKYYFQISFAGTLLLRSDDVLIMDEAKNTLLLEYRHYEYREDMIFETGIFPGIRIPGTKKYDKTAAKNTVYEDQVLDIEILRSINYRIWKLILGGSEGLPDHIADKVSRMLGCSDFLIDGKYYSIADGATLEPNEQENYPLRGWRIDLREKLNRASRQYSDVTAQNAELAVIVNVDSKGFGLDTGGSETVVIDVQ